MTKTTLILSNIWCAALVILQDKIELAASLTIFWAFALLIAFISDAVANENPEAK